MKEQRVVVPLLEGVHSSDGVLGFWHVTTIGDVKCRVHLPRRYGSFAGKPLGPPHDDGHPLEPDWPKVEWGYINDDYSATIRAVGVLPIYTPIPPGDELLAFDRAVGRWKRLLRDWLSVITEGPTDFLEPAWGETVWGSRHHDIHLRYESEVHFPERVSGWQWNHALEHAGAGDQPSLARTLLTTATRAEATGNWRLAIIDAATAAEVALTTGLTTRLSAEASPQVVQALIERTRMLGPRLHLARDLSMTLPTRIQPDLLEHRNAVVHRGTEVTGSHARAAIVAAREVVDEYEPLAAHCREPFDDDWEPPDDE